MSCEVKWCVIVGIYCEDIFVFPIPITEKFCDRFRRYKTQQINMARWWERQKMEIQILIINIFSCIHYVTVCIHTEWLLSLSFLQYLNYFMTLYTTA